MVSFSVKLSVVFSAFFVVKGTLIPNGTVPLDCGSQQTFTCSVTGIAALWTIDRLGGISITRDNGLGVANYSRITTTDTDGGTPISAITIRGFTTADDGATIQCINLNDNGVQGMASISVEPLPPPSNATATTVGHNCTVITLQWDEPDTPSDITSEVSYTSSSPFCNASCTSSPCDITNLTLNTEYTFTVTLDSGMCGKSMNTTTTATTMDVPSQLMNVDAQLIEDTSVVVTWDQPSNDPPVTSVKVTCMPSSTNCRTCPPSSPCTISGLETNTTYTITVTPNNNCGDGIASSVNVTTNFTDSGTIGTPTPELPIVVIVVPIVAAIVLVILIVIIIVVVVIWYMKKKHGVKDNSTARMSRLRSNEERANLGEDTYASPGTEKPQPDTTDGVYSYAATETKIGAQMKEREQQKKQPPPQGDFYEEPNAAKNVQHKAGTITGETYAQPDKPKRGTKKKDKQQKEPVPHKEAPAGELYAMPDKKKDVSHTSGPVTGDEYAVASKPKTGGGYGAHGPQ